ncbi:pentapeptide repeat-containing protein [Paenibacillus tritici]|uniref:pentapeptide repeat-containing protein n=1 Tax=Paenibacillus tritici TaxID=1873425 RepID=UPI001BAA1165|nr:pentapeptide repeat-containing protein [Paenibacillus tritici]QUL54892.1 pentapeptide repeat-containing protein [Paenibacillus tritici]
MNKKSLLARWQGDQLSEVNRLIAAITGKSNLHHKDRSFPASPYGLTEAGLEDYRGVTLTETLQYLTVQGVDLSYARFEDSASLNTSTFTHCGFDGVKLDGRFVTHTFSHCSFRGAKLNNARISKEFHDCDFTGCNLSKVIANDVSFTRCRFSGANFRWAIFTYCRFEECSFEGAICQDSSFAGSRFKGETGLLPVWDNAILDHVKFLSFP